MYDTYDDDGKVRRFRNIHGCKNVDCQALEWNGTQHGDKYRSLGILQSSLSIVTSSYSLETMSLTSFSKRMPNP